MEARIQTGALPAVGWSVLLAILNYDLFAKLALQRNPALLEFCCDVLFHNGQSGLKTGILMKWQSKSVILSHIETVVMLYN
jgi:hypothetical protein